MIENNKFNVVIGVIKDSKINDYTLDKPDFDDEKNKISKRVDIWHLNKQTKINKSKEEVNKIYENYNKIYKSLTYIKKIPIEKLFEQDDKRLKELEDTETRYKNELSEKEGAIENYKNQLSAKDNELSEKEGAILEYKNQIQNYKEQLKENEKEKLLFDLFKKSDAYKEFIKTKEYQDLIAKNENKK